ncbi:hypothetical protein DV736_g477, partial [Chaetothyriales sp. CBS 134916]
MGRPRPSSSPQASSPAPATDDSPLALSRSLSVADCFSSPHSFRGATRKFSSSSLATGYHLSLPLLDLNDRVLANEDMTSPLPPRHSKSQPSYLPLSVRNSTLFPFDFNPAEAMAELEHKAASPMFAPLFVRSLSEGAGSEVHGLAKMQSDEGVSVTLDANYKSSSNKQAGETQRAIESLSFTTPARSKTGIRAFSDSCTSTASATPSKNNLGNLLKELGSPRSNQETKCSTPSIVNVTRTKGRSPSHGSMATPPKRHDLILSPRSTIRSILSPRSFSATDLFYSRNRSKFQDEYDGNEVVGDLDFLSSQPPPDPSQHPSVAADPFSSNSMLPTMSTQMTISQARQWAIEFYRGKKQRWMESQTRPFAKGEPFPIFKQPGWISKDEELIAVQIALAAAKALQNEKQDVRTSQASPAPKNSRTPKTPLRIDTKAANSPTTNNHAGTRTATPLTDDTSKKSESASVRSFSNLFKSRSTTDRSSTSSIYQEKGKLFVRGDSKVFRFQNGKTESLFLQRKNPRRIAWTMLYRRMHKKGISEEVAKKRNRRTVKHQRAVVGASLDVIKERRSMRPEARAAARQAAIKEGKDKKAAAESKKKAEKAKSAATAARGQVRGGIASKQQAKGAQSKPAAGKGRL